MSLAIFDLDNTLLAGDSDHAWGEFLVTQGVVDETAYRRANEAFYRDYQDGTLNIDAFLSFSLQPLAQHSLARLNELHSQFMLEVVAPMRLKRADALLDAHRQRGDFLLIITATNRFITAPIAAALGVDDILATEPEFDGQRYTGAVVQPPCFQAGKIIHLDRWLAANPNYSIEGSCFYSDSHNDLPLLERVSYPVAVNPDDKLAAHASAQNWPILDLRSGPASIEPPFAASPTTR